MHSVIFCVLVATLFKEESRENKPNLYLNDN